MMASEKDREAPRILSMEVTVPTDDEDHDDVDSYYRVKADGQVKYLAIAPKTLEPDLYSFPLDYLPPIRYNDMSWTSARIRRDQRPGELQVEYSQEKLQEVETVWLDKSFDVLNLPRIEQLTASAFETLRPKETFENSDISSLSGQESSHQFEAIAKIARFQWEIPRIEQETRAYQLLHLADATSLAPRFLGHIHENGRVMGFLLEKLQGRTHASLENRHECEEALKKLHAVGLLHGDVNRYNFLIGPDSVQMIDFEHSREGASEEDKAGELQSLPAEFLEDTGRGGGFMSSDDD